MRIIYFPLAQVIKKRLFTFHLFDQQNWYLEGTKLNRVLQAGLWQGLLERSSAFWRGLRGYPEFVYSQRYSPEHLGVGAFSCDISTEVFSTNLMLVSITKERKLIFRYCCELLVRTPTPKFSFKIQHAWGGGVYLAPDQARFNSPASHTVPASSPRNNF